MAAKTLAAALALATVANAQTCTGNSTVFGLSFTPINGSASVPMSHYSGTVVLFLNVASFWGETTPYYTGLATLAKQYAGQPFRILGQPCNQFGGQEPGSNSEIQNCVTYVRPGNGYVIPSTMDFTEKGDVNGILATPLAANLKKQCGGADVLWNFEAWAISKTGVPYKRYLTGTGPLNMVKDIDYLLAQ